VSINIVDRPAGVAEERRRPRPHAWAERPAPALAMALSAVAALLLALPVFVVVAAHSEGCVFRGDGTAYFMMARSLVVDHDTDLTDEYHQLDARLPADSPVMMAVRLSVKRVPGRDRIYLPWPVGAGLVMAPFYAAGYAAELAAAHLGGRAPDSYGAIPQLAFGAGTVAYALLGFWASFFTCRRLAGAAPAAWSAGALVLGGPLLYYVFLHPSMSHPASFGLLALFVLLWWRRWDGEAAGPPWALWLLYGLLVVVRYQNVIFGLLPLALALREARRDARRGGAAAWAATGTGALACLAPLGLQLVELARTGQLGGHGAAGGRLAFGGNELSAASPHFWEVLFSCQHGAFYWTPVIGLGFAALLWCARRASWARVFTAVFLADVYLIGCLVSGNWAGDHAFGMRYLGDSAALLAPALAIALSHAGRDRVGRLASRAVLALLVAGNALLASAFALRTVAHDSCVTYPQMARGIAAALSKLAGSPLASWLQPVPARQAPPAAVLAAAVPLEGSPVSTDH
jgi:hypothetical protein